MIDLRTDNSDNEHSIDEIKEKTETTSKSYTSSYTDLIHDLTKTHPNPEYEHFESYAYAL